MDVEKNLNLLTEIASNLTKVASDNEKSALLVINPPTFKCKESEDIFELLESFEEQTSTLTDNQKKSLLPKAFKGQTKIWYKTTVAPLVNELSWSDIKRRVIGRYSPKDLTDFYSTKLDQIVYDSTKYPKLLPFVEEFAYIHTKAHPGVDEAIMVKALNNRLPMEVVGVLNRNVAFKDIKSMEEYKEAVRNCDNYKMLKHPDHKEPVSIGDIQKLIEAAVQKITAPTQLSSVTTQPEVIARNNEVDSDDFATLTA